MNKEKHRKRNRKEMNVKVNMDCNKDCSWILIRNTERKGQYQKQEQVLKHDVIVCEAKRGVDTS
jgi:hypothetical protein